MMTTNDLLFLLSALKNNNKRHIKPRNLLEVSVVFWWYRVLNGIKPQAALYKILHCFFFAGFGASSAARAASSNTFPKPSCNFQISRWVRRVPSWYGFELFFTWVNAEHSTYLTAFSLFAIFSPCSSVIGFCLYLANFSNVLFSSRKSICVPTSKNGVFWQ